jgi:CBS-domain-containing membrane protein
MFRTLGLRHLCVINKHNQVLGIVTRADLVAAHALKQRSEERKERKKGRDFMQHTIDLDVDDDM